MRKIVFFVLLTICVGVIVFSCREELPVTSTDLYVVDAELMRLIPIEVEMCKTDKDGQAKFVIERLISGFDENPKIRRLIPDIKNAMSVKVKGSTAYVNISNKMVKNHPDGRVLEKLTVYSIVNSLTEIDGINSVRFTVNKKVTKKFMGYLDMRNIFRKEDVV